ncbi:hypothetical protein A9G29_11485 [Gilliamella sp. Fer2-1]|nr:hypothetical protein A9G29_11485 [Gilliamella apicola]
MGLERCPIFADTNFLDAAVKGDSGALDIIREGKTYLTPNQLHEFLNVSDKNQLNARKKFLAKENIEIFNGEKARLASNSSEFKKIFDLTIKSWHSRGDAALVVFAKTTGYQVITSERRLTNFFNLSMPKLGVPIARHKVRR